MRDTESALFDQLEIIAERVDELVATVGFMRAAMIQYADTMGLAQYEQLAAARDDDDKAYAAALRTRNLPTT